MFRYDGDISNDAATGLRRDMFDAGEVAAAFDYSRSITHESKHAGINGAQVMLAVHDGDRVRAGRMLEALVRRNAIDEERARSLRLQLDNAG